MKSKLLIITAFVAVFVFGSLVNGLLINPSVVEAANTADKTCKETYGLEDRVKGCVIGYNGGYAGKAFLQTCGSSGSPVNGLTYGGPSATYQYCSGGHQFGVAQRKQDGVQVKPPEGNDLEDRAKLACKETYGDSGDKAEACKRGYRAAYARGATSESVTAACDKEENDALVNACQEGVDEANRDNIEINEPSPTAEQTVQKHSKKEKEGKEVCEGEDQKGGRLDPCIKGYLAGKAGDKKDDACKRYPDGSERKEACEKGHALGVAAAKEENDQADCDMQLSSILSWIACPVIDMGVNFTDWVFEGFVQPMLENVPVSTDPKHGTYQAWSQFRLIANLLLVGSLLMIVYSQAKGGK
jgi:hypothetical protein